MMESMRPDGLTFNLSYVSITLLLKCREEARLQPFLGSALRGALGQSLKKSVCLPQCRAVDTCILRERCAYAICFETPVPANSSRLRGQDRIPHPIVIEPPLDEKANWSRESVLGFGLTMFGRAIDYFPYLLAAADVMGKSGLGALRVKFLLEKAIDQRTGSEVWPGPEGLISMPQAGTLTGAVHTEENEVERVELTWETPVRLVEGGGLIRHPSFRTLVRALLARLSSLLYFHGGRALEADFRGLLERASAVTTELSDLELKRLSRWSNRQQAKVPLDGLVGSVTYSGAALGEFLPLLRAGEIMHVGKGTVFGLGKYRVEEV